LYRIQHDFPASASGSAAKFVANTETETEAWTGTGSRLLRVGTSFRACLRAVDPQCRPGGVWPRDLHATDHRDRHRAVVTSEAGPEGPAYSAFCRRSLISAA